MAAPGRPALPGRQRGSPAGVPTGRKPSSSSGASEGQLAMAAPGRPALPGRRRGSPAGVPAGRKPASSSGASEGQLAHPDGLGQCPGRAGRRGARGGRGSRRLPGEAGGGGRAPESKDSPPWTGRNIRRNRVRPSSASGQARRPSTIPAATCLLPECRYRPERPRPAALPPGAPRR